MRHSFGYKFHQLHGQVCATENQGEKRVFAGSKWSADQFVGPTPNTFDAQVVIETEQQHRNRHAHGHGQIGGRHHAQVGVAWIMSGSAVDRTPDFGQQVKRQQIHGIEQKNPGKHGQGKRCHELATARVVNNGFGLGVYHFKEDFDRRLEPARHA